MGDTKVDIVDIEVRGEVDVVAVHDRMREWLLDRGVIRDERDSALGGGVLWLPGPAATTTVDLDPGREMWSEGVEFVSARQVFSPVELVGRAARCPRCGGEEDCDAWQARSWDVFNEWWDSDGVDLLPCARCGADLRVSDWEWVDGERWALGEFAISFWNWWQPLSEEFVADLTRELGHETCVISVRM
ncbi:hypothetical protein ABLE92_22740 [Gordonia sp. VNQ95]|uniref:hypothetical protein n=1 Tax=Gordonia TaxID=2053 RepID=UPI0032B3DD43